MLPLLILELEVGQLLRGGVAHDEIGKLFLRGTNKPLQLEVQATHLNRCGELVEQTFQSVFGL
jgi:hypothetical protein